MCGRYVRKDGTPVFSFFEINDRRVEWRPSYNVAPATKVPAVRREDGGNREIVELTWGLVPAWAKPDAKLPLMINARAETVASKPAYRSAFKARRCIVPASGYFEWQKLPDGGKQPFYFERTDGNPIAFAAIWEGQTVATITTEPNKEAGEIHDRMPVMLTGENLARFLDPEPLTPEEREKLLAPAPDGTLALWPVSKLVGSVRNNEPGLIEPVPVGRPLPTRPMKNEVPQPEGNLFG